MPLIDKDASNAVVYQVCVSDMRWGVAFVLTCALQGDEKWALESNGKAVKTHDTSDLRMTIVYR